jgi:hypothetical protein
MDDPEVDPQRRAQEHVERDPLPQHRHREEDINTPSAAVVE